MTALYVPEHAVIATGATGNLVPTPQGIGENALPLCMSDNTK
jgi:hypothetical protein